MLDALPGHQIDRGIQLHLNEISQVDELDPDRTIEIDDDVDVAARSLFAPRERPEDADGADMEPPLKLGLDLAKNLLYGCQVLHGSLFGRYGRILPRKLEIMRSAGRTWGG